MASNIKNTQNKNAPVKDFLYNSKLIFSLLATYKFKIILTILLAIGSTVFIVLAPKVISYVVNTLFKGLKDIVENNGSIDFNALFLLLFLGFSLYLASTICSLFQNTISVEISRKVCYKLRKKLIDKVLNIPLSYYEQTARGNLMSRVVNDVDVLAQNVSNVFVDIITATCLIIGSIVMMFSINWILTLIILFLVPLSLFIGYFIVRFSQGHFINQQNNLGYINDYVEEYFNGHQLVQAYNNQDIVIEKFNKLNNNLFKEGFKASVIGGISTPVFNFFNNFIYVLVVIVGAYLSIIGLFTVGDIIAFTSYVYNFTNPLRSLVAISTEIQKMAAACRRVYEFLDLPSEDDAEKVDNNACSEKDIKWDGHKPILEFQNVKFGYKKDITIINDFSLKVKQGQTVAIVGPTGAGKTTLLKLLLRFYDLDEGCIKLYGTDISQLRYKVSRNNNAVVLQDLWYYNGSIEGNICYGRDDVDSDVAKWAAKLSCADTFINNLPDKYEFILTPGGMNISHGERQLLAIARAIATEKEIFLLDEATSSVDSATEKKLYNAFDEVIEAKTTIVIAHRLSTIRNADVILVLNNGDVIEQGNHEELLAKKGFYYDLWTSATG